MAGELRLSGPFDRVGDELLCAVCVMLYKGTALSTDKDIQRAAAELPDGKVGWRTLRSGVPVQKAVTWGVTPMLAGMQPVPCPFPVPLCWSHVTGLQSSAIMPVAGSLAPSGPVLLNERRRA